jgi:hypothetical protein
LNKKFIHYNLNLTSNEYKPDRKKNLKFISFISKEITDKNNYTINLLVQKQKKSAKQSSSSSVPNNYRGSELRPNNFIKSNVIKREYARNHLQNDTRTKLTS